MRVLVACEFSGIVREAFRSQGHDAWSCDTLPTEQDGPHIQDDVLNHLDDKWDLMIGHPPCTYLTNAGVRHLHDNITSRNGNHTSIYGEARWQEMIKAAEFFIALAKAPIPRICLENPVPHGYAAKIIGKYSQLVQPWHFGHAEKKATCFWLKNLPYLRPTHTKGGGFFSALAPTDLYARVHRQSPSPDRWKNRSRTLTGIADAMAHQWNF